MTGERRSLIVCPEPPYPLYGGGALRTAAMMHYLAGRSRLDAVFFHEEGTPDPREALPAGLVTESAVIRLPRHGRGFLARAARNLVRFVRGVPPLVDRFSGHGGELALFRNRRRWDVAVVEHFWCAPYAEVLREAASTLVLDLHNIESTWHRRQAGFEYPWLHRRFAAAAARWESRWLREYDRVLVTSEEDGRQVQGVFPEVYPNTIPRWTGKEARREQQIITTANFHYAPNRDAVHWFAGHIWPRVAARHPHHRWVLAGRGSEQFAGLPGVITTGTVPDTRLYISASQVAVVPVRSGSGTRLKILEAWSTRTPVVSTTLGAEGLPQEGVRIADDAETFARQIADLLENPPAARLLAERAFDLYNKDFTWEAGWEKLDQAGGLFTGGVRKVGVSTDYTERT